MFEADTYAITYDANADDATGSVSADQYVWDGSPVVLDDGSGLSRAGYTFAGWSESADGSAVDAAAYTTGDDVTLFALWSANTNSVSFSVGTVDGVSAPAAISYVTGAELSLPGLEVPTGYTFLGWSLTDGALEATDPADMTITSDVVLYAVIAAETYTVTYDGNVGDGPLDGSTFGYTYGDVAPVLSDGTGLVREGYTFAGWSSVVDDASTQVAADWLPTDDVTLFALWSANTYTVSYDVNGGSGSVTAASYTTAGDALSLDDASGVSAPVGYHFAGWSTEVDNAETVVDSTFAPTSAVTLFAVWAGDVYDVTFDANGADGSVPAPVQYTVGSDSGLMLDDATAAEHYSFVGWSSSASDASALVDASGFVPAADNTVLYAVFEADTYAITYDANAGTGDVASDFYTWDGAETVLDSGSGLSRDGYTFAGWTTDPDNALTTVSPSAFTTEADVTLFALWTAETYDVTFSANGVDGGVLPANTSFTTGSTPLVLSAATPPTGYSFDGWSTSETDPSLTVDATAFSPVNDTILFAVFTPATYVVTYDANAGSGGVDHETISYTVGDAAPTLDDGATVARDGYTFAGWSTESGDNNNAPVATGWVPTATGTLYAVWTPKNYAINFDVSSLTGAVAPLAQSFTFGGIVPTLDEPTAPTGYHFVSWNETVDTSLASAQTLTAHFEPNVYFVRLIGVPDQDPTFTFNGPAPVIPDPVAPPGYSFDGWTGSGWTGSVDTSIPGDLELEAIFTPDPPPEPSPDY